MCRVEEVGVVPLSYSKDTTKLMLAHLQNIKGTFTGTNGEEAADQRPSRGSAGV